MMKYVNDVRPKIQMLPFDQNTKMKFVVRKTRDPKIVRVYAQGAPELLI